MNVYSGECEYGKCGTPTDLIDNTGERLRVGDIVMVSSQEDGRTPWHHGLSVVVENRPNLTGNAPAPDAYVMGIVSVDINNDDHWVVTRVKRWEDVVDGEHWAAYGFNYRMPNTRITDSGKGWNVPQVNPNETARGEAQAMCRMARIDIANTFRAYLESKESEE